MNKITRKEAFKRMINGRFFITHELPRKEIIEAYEMGWVIIDKSGLKTQAFALPIS